MPGVRFQFYRTGGRTVVEFYKQHKSANCTLDGRKLTISFDGAAPDVFELATPAELQNFHSEAAGRKLVVELAINGP